jgi:ABC-type taurine transport system ATPase subunit
VSEVSALAVAGLQKRYRSVTALGGAAERSELLKLVGLSDAAGRRVEQMSKGMRQRLGIVGLHALGANQRGFAGVLLNLGPFGSSRAGSVWLDLWSAFYLGVLAAIATVGFAHRDL